MTASRIRTVRETQRLVLSDCTLEQTIPDGSPRTFVPCAYGVVHRTDSATGKRGGDVTVYPWHRVAELRTWREVRMVDRDG